MPQLELYSTNVCPYVHRTRLTLLEKGLDATLTQLDPHNKPDWFYDISPYGRVPVLKHGDVRVYESAIINEYLDEVFPSPKLMPDNAADRAQARIWIDFCNTRFNTVMYALLRADDETTRQEHAPMMEERLHFLEDEALATTSEKMPYWFGDRVSLTDIAFYPFFERFVVLEHYCKITIPERCKRIHRWLEAMQALDSVQAIMNPPEYYIEQYRDFGKPSSEQEVSACPIPQKPA